MNVDKFFSDTAKWNLNVYGSASYVDAIYLSDDNININGNRVELAPELTYRVGANLRWKGLGVGWKFSYTGDQFTDATNSVFTSNAVNGLVPSYFVQDASISYEKGFVKLEAGVNNLANEIYFTRRASGYPGPGIIPSAGRLWYCTLQLKLP